MKKSILIIIVALLGLIITTPNPANLFVKENSNYAIVKSMLTPCKKVVPNKTKQKVILRIDDIQAFAWTEVSKKMIDDALARRASVTLGVIPFGLEQDKNLVEFLKRRSCNLEFALHGWDHSDNPAEFANLTFEAADQKILQGINTLKLLSNKKTLTFIPPQNIYSSEAKRAIYKNGIKILSAEGEGSFDYTATTYDFTNAKLNSAEDVVDECNKTFVDQKTCIIMLHPQDYTTNNIFDEVKYEEYLKIIDKLNLEGVNFTTFENEIINNLTYSDSI